MKLRPHMAQIAAWRDEPLSYGEIADRLMEMGVEVTDRAVGFACEKLGKGGHRAVRPPPLKADPEWARELRRQGVEIWLISRRLGVSRVTVWKHLKEAR